MVRHFLRFLKFYFRAKTRYRIHSPFVFDFVENVLEDDRWFYSFKEIEGIRKFMLADFRKISITDFGAGSQVTKNKERTISSLAKHSANQPFVCRWLFKIVNEYKPKRMLELGTSLGISSCYQSQASLGGQLVTIEGDPEVAHLAAGNFKLMKVKNIALIEGTFEEVLPMAINEMGQLDYVFFDGNHREEPTLDYFHQCLEKSHEKSIFVFDDIHWSDGMESAWEKIKEHPQVRLSIDLFFFGVVFFRKDFKKKEHYALVPWLWKPWSIGLRDFFGG